MPTTEQPEAPAHDQPPAGEAPTGPVVKTVDFSQPTKFNGELRRRIERALNLACEAYTQRLSSELRTPVELTLADATQLTWAAAKARLSASTIAVALHVHPIDRQLLLCVEPPFVLQALERLLGGDVSAAPPERRLTEIDWALTRRLLASLATHLSAAWRDLGELELELGKVDLEDDAEVLAPTAEPTLAITLATAIAGLPSSMTLLIPWSAIEPVAARILAGGAGGLRSLDPDSREAHAVRRNLSCAHVLLRAEVGSLQMPVERVLALAPGALLTLSDRAADGVRLCAEGTPLSRAQPGLRGARRAVKITALEPTGGLLAGAAARPHPESAARVLTDDPDASAPADALPVTREHLGRMLGIPVRVWAELGRTTLPLGEALELPPGSVLQLDQSTEDPIELFVNGTPFAHGTLQVDGDGFWTVRVEALV